MHLSALGGRDRQVHDGPEAPQSAARSELIQLLQGEFSAVKGLHARRRQWRLMGGGEAGSYICRLQPIRDLIYAAWFDEVADLGIGSLHRHLNSTSLLSCNCHLASAIGTTIYILSAGAHVSLNNNDAY